MSTGLFDSPPLPGRHELADEPGYRPVSGTAIAAVILALLSPLVFLGWPLVAVPAAGAILALAALRDVAARAEAVVGGGLARLALGVSTVVLVAGIASLTITYLRELPEGFTRIHYGLLQPLPGDPPTAVPESARGLDGRDVLLKGYMYPGSRQHGITEFVLCRDQGDCCFGGQPKITDRVIVRLADPEGIDFTPRLVKIAGRFRVEPAGAPELGGGVLYHLDGASAR